MDDQRGRGIVRADLAGTAVFVVAAALGAASKDLARVVLAPWCGVLSAVGVAAFVVSYFTAVGRSRESEIAVSQLYGVAGDVAPARVKRALRLALWTQIVVAVAVMVLGFSRVEPDEFNWAACAVGAPLFGLGLNGIWVSRHGTFGPRILTPRTSGRARRAAQSRDSDSEMEQNSPHG